MGTVYLPGFLCLEWGRGTGFWVMSSLKSPSSFVVDSELIRAKSPSTRLFTWHLSSVCNCFVINGASVLPMAWVMEKSPSPWWWMLTLLILTWSFQQNEINTVCEDPGGSFSEEKSDGYHMGMQQMKLWVNGATWLTGGLGLVFDIEGTWANCSSICSF